MSAPTELHHHESPEPKRPPLLTGFQWALVIPALATAVAAAGWLVGDLVYRGHFDPPAAWWIVFLSALTASATFVNRCGQERVIARQDRIIEYLSEMHTYHSDLGDRLDQYGDAREIRGHHLAATVIQSNGNGHRRLSVVDGD